MNARNLKRGYVENFQIPLPPLDIQKQIVAEIEAHQSEIDRLRSAVKDGKQKIAAVLARVWGE